MTLRTHFVRGYVIDFRSLYCPENILRFFTWIKSFKKSRVVYFKRNMIFRCNLLLQLIEIFFFYKRKRLLVLGVYFGVPPNDAALSKWLYDSGRFEKFRNDIHVSFLSIISLPMWCQISYAIMLTRLFYLCETYVNYLWIDFGYCHK